MVVALEVASLLDGCDHVVGVWVGSSAGRVLELAPAVVRNARSMVARVLVRVLSLLQRLCWRRVGDEGASEERRHDGDEPHV